MMQNTRLDDFGMEFKSLVNKKLEWNDFLAQGKALLSELVLDPTWFRPVLSKLVLDEAFLKSQWLSIDPNDLQIYRDADKAFSIRAFIWEPSVRYPIHDHGAWGIVGAHINRVGEIKYERVDDGSNPDYAEVRAISEAILSPGEITVVMPVNDGIHQMAAMDGKTAVSIHIYGSPVRKGYIHYYNAHNHTAHRMYPPYTDKKVLAIRTLGSVPEEWSESVLNDALKTDGPDFIKMECRLALEKMKG